MKTLKDAIGIIMAQPPELHYPAYYADLLSEADVPETNIGASGADLLYNFCPHCGADMRGEDK